MVKVTLLAYTSNPERLVAAAAKNCYSASETDSLYEGLTDEKASDFVEMLSLIGHESPIEHASFTFGIDGVSRTLLAQLTRHRIASYSVKSQRYVDEADFKFVMPPEIEKNPAAKDEFINTMGLIGESYKKLCDMLEDSHAKELEDSGISRQEAQKAAKKLACEDARYVLPNACETKIVMTMNARSLKNFFKLRCCNRAQWEIRFLAEEMYRLVVSVAPSIFRGDGPACVSEPCPEGKMSCGKSKEMRQKYDELYKASAAQNA